ncbi:uncharacterized protein LOC136029302 [Artemia franciscana]|uniref:uncharacterized protein LOC136029302 n=1 Tax=Artemia franciscana TaxID=6661 RepID=UPI0032D9B350
MYLFFVLSTFAAVNAFPFESTESQVDGDEDGSLEDLQRPARTVDNTGFNIVPEIGYSDYNYDKPYQGNTVMTYGYRIPPGRYPTPSGYDYSSMIAPGYNDPSAPIVYGISRYPNHIKSAATGMAKVFAADTNSNFITSDPAWKFGPAPLTQHAASYLAGNGPMRRNYNSRQARVYQSLPYSMPYY